MRAGRHAVLSAKETGKKTMQDRNLWLLVGGLLALGAALIVGHELLDALESVDGLAVRGGIVTSAVIEQAAMAIKDTDTGEELLEAFKVFD